MRIAIVIPTGDLVHTSFSMCLTKLVAFNMTQHIECMLINPRSSMVQKGRWQGVKEALHYSPDKILFIDSDQTFPHDALTRLIKHNKKIISATCRMRDGSDQYTARNGKGNRINFSNRKGLHEVASNGFPFMLIDAEVFQKILEPWFNVEFKDGKWISEDEWFCREARKSGYKVWVDADLTQKIGHIGTKEY